MGTPLVTVGIPTYNRATFVARAIESVLSQDYPHLEILISDNCSTDSTPNVCQGFADRNPRIRFLRQARNVGATRNFVDLLEHATGDYFMWLGDDDYVDRNYITTALRHLVGDPTVALAGGVAKYYRSGHLIDTGRKFDVSAGAWWARVVSYYWKVSDNGMFYGLMRISAIRGITIKNSLGGDWLVIARVAASGKLVMSDQTTVHRELGGASQSHAQTVRSLGLPRIHALFPYILIAANAFSDIAEKGSSYQVFGTVQRRSTAALVFCTLLVRALTTASARLLVGARNRISRRRYTA